MSETVQFVTVADADEIKPGERIVVEINDVWIIVFNVGGAFYAVEDMCSHEEYYLSEGELQDHAIECPKHGACFDIRTGQHLTPPAVSPIKTFPTRIEGNVLQVGVP